MGEDVLFITEYEVRPELSREDDKRLMDLFGQRGKAPGEIAHYARLDGGGGYIIVDTDDTQSLYERILEFSEFMEFTITPILHIDDAVGPILKVLAD
jgi:hypothetical protein